MNAFAKPLVWLPKSQSVLSQAWSSAWYLNVVPLLSLGISYIQDLDAILVSLHQWHENEQNDACVQS